MKKIAAVILATTAVFGMAACSTDAEVASENLSKAADQFEVARHIVFVNGVTDEYLLEVSGFCSVQPDVADSQLEVTCKATEDERGFVKHFFGISDNTPYFVEQISPVDVSTSRPRVIFKPEALIPNVDRP